VKKGQFDVPAPALAPARRGERHARRAPVAALQRKLGQCAVGWPPCRQLPRRQPQPFLPEVPFLSSTAPLNVLILGASYGSLLASKLLLAGHSATLVCAHRNFKRSGL